MPFVSDATAQTSHDNEYWKQYYSDATSEEIWRDYIYIRTQLNELDSLGDIIFSLQEPFKSWAKDKFLEIAEQHLASQTLTESIVRNLLSSDYPEDIKRRVFESYSIPTESFAYTPSLNSGIKK